MSARIEMFITACQKPLMFVQSERYESVCAFVDSHDIALGGGCLAGFREWLMTQCDTWTNLPWPFLLRKIEFPSLDPIGALSEAESKQLLISLEKNLAHYLGCRESGGLPAVFLKYYMWLESHPNEINNERRAKVFDAAHQTW
jgi:hypothetical protein